MKTAFTLLLCLGLSPGAGLLRAQEPLPLEQVAAPAIRLSQEELATLLGPIALYPDPLVAIILPASTFPSDIVLAARFAESGADPALADNKPWDSSIKSLARYPDTLKWLDENLEWTTQLGEAYLAQPEDVMNVIQDLRRRAEAAGNLVDTPQQRIVRDDTYVRIVPAQPEYIYVPQYDPEIVYIERPYPVVRPLLTFSTGFVIGSWLNFDFDWHHRRLYCGDWHRDRGWDYDYHHHRDRDRDYDRGRGDVRINNNTTVNNININNNITNVQVWQGDARRRLAATRSLTAARSGSVAFDRNRDGVRDGVRDGTGIRAGRQSPILKPKQFTELASSNTNFRRPVDEDGRRPFQGFNGGRDGDRSGPGNDNNRGKGGDRDRDGKDRFVMPNTEAPVVSGDARTKGSKGWTPGNRDGGPGNRPGLPGVTGNNQGNGKGPAVRDPKIPDRSGNNPPNVRPGTPAPGVKDFLPDGRPNGSGRGNDDKGDGKGPSVRDPKIPDRDNNSPTVRPGVPATPGAKDFLPDGRPSSPGRDNDDKGNGKGPSVRDPKSPNRGNNPSVVRPATPAPNVKDFVPGDRSRGPGNDSKSKNDDNDKARPSDRPSIRDGVPGGIPRPSQPPSIPNVGPRDDGGRSNGGNKGSSKPQVMPRAPSASPVQRDAPKPQVMPRPDAPRPKSSPQVNREMPKPKMAVPERRDPPKVQSAPPRRDPPKVQSAPVRRDPPKVQSAPVRRDPPKVQSSPPKPRSAPQVQRSAPKPKPQASAPVKRSAPQVSPQRRPSPPKVQASRPAPKPQARPSSSSSKKSSDDDKKKKR